MKNWLIWLLLSLSGNAVALELGNGIDMPIERFGSTGDRIIWVPSEYGVHGDNHRKLAQGIAELGFEVWLVDVHGGYFLAPGRSSLLTIPPGDMAALIQRCQTEDKRLFILSAGRGAALMLMAVRQWQMDNPQQRPLGGLLLLNPNLLARPPEPGTAAEYLSIAHTSNVPVFILQPQNSAKYWYLRDLEDLLSQGGSSVFSLPLANASDGYHVRDDATDIEKQLTAQLPKQIKSAVKFLSHYNQVARRAISEGAGREPDWQVETPEPDLRPLQARPAPLVLTDLAGQRHDLNDYRGHVVLLNFWATWCPPCVTEIPSLGRLQAHFDKHNFRVLSVNVGEPASTVRAFLDQVPAAFAVLLDPAGLTAKPWQLHAFPLTFLLDRQGQIRYGYFGALEWDKPEIIAKVASLLAE